MSDDVLITPASRKVEFKDSNGTVDAVIQTDASGNLQITNTGGDISIGDTTSDVYIGDGTNNVDIVFEQNGEIRGETGVTLTVGASGSTTNLAGTVQIGGTELTATGAELNILDGVTATATEINKLDGVTATTAELNHTDGVTSNIQTQLDAKASTSSATTSTNGLMSSSDKTKLDGIESNATADQTAAEIRTLVESASDSNVFTDADHTKLNGIESNATADQTKSDIDALGINADQVDGIEAASFLRSDATDTATGALTFGNTFTLNGSQIGNYPSLNFESGSGSTSFINFGTSTDADEGQIKYTPSTNTIAFTAGTVNTLNITDTTIAATKDITLPDDEYVKFGASNDMLIGHQSTYNANIIDAVGSIAMSTDNSILLKKSSLFGESIANFNADGSVDLYYDSSKKFETTSTGILSSGDVQFGGSDNGLLEWKTSTVPGPFSGQFNEYIILQNKASTTEQELYLIDTGDGNDGDIFGIASNNAPVFAITGNSAIKLMHPNTSSYDVTIEPTTPTANRTLTLPNASGTVALTSDITGLTIEDEGTALSTAAETLNFVGSGVTASGTGTEKTITIPGANTILDISKFQYTATANQTTFSGADNDSNSLTYTAGDGVNVYLNGILLDSEDYTASNGTSVVLDTGAAAGDTLTVTAAGTSSITGTVSSYNKTEFSLNPGATSVSIGTSENTSVNKYVLVFDRMGVSNGPNSVLLNIEDTASTPVDINWQGTTSVGSSASQLNSTDAYNGLSTFHQFDEHIIELWRTNTSGNKWYLRIMGPYSLSGNYVIQGSNSNTVTGTIGAFVFGTGSSNTWNNVSGTLWEYY